MVRLRTFPVLRIGFAALCAMHLAFCVAVAHAQGGSLQPQSGPPAAYQNRAPVPQPAQSGGQRTAAGPALQASVQSNGRTAQAKSVPPAGGLAASGSPGSAQNAAQGYTQAPETLEQMPPSAPQVTYQNGQLSIQAQNSTLAQVLRSVQARTGAQVEMPGGTSSERVVASLTGTPRDVLATLLDGSHFNYVILGVPGNSDGVQRIILTSRQNVGVQNANAGGGHPPQVTQPQAQAQPQPEPEEDPAADEAQQNDQPEQPEVGGDDAQNAQPPGAPGQFQRFPTPVPGQVQGEAQGQTPENAAPNGVKTPEQLLQELQRMQQQQQQYQQQLNPANQGQQPEQPPQPQ